MRSNATKYAAIHKTVDIGGYVAPVQEGSASDRNLVAILGRSLSNNYAMPRLVPPFLSQGTMGSRSQPVLRIDDHLKLRSWTQADVPALVAAYSDPDIQRWNLNTLDEDEAAKIVVKWNNSWLNETSAHWAITRTSDDLAIGRVGLRTLDLAAGNGEISYWVAPSARGFGVASIATWTLSEWLFHDFGLHRLELGHSTQNLASCHVATRTGFVLECTMKSALLHSDGWHDMHWHARIGPDTV